MHIFKDTHFDFLRWRWHAIILSWVVIIAGLVTVWTQGIPKGVEFAGGTVVIERFEGAATVQQVARRWTRTTQAAARTPSCRRLAIPTPTWS
jgi:preprotein translocase subunit SecF